MISSDRFIARRSAEPAEWLGWHDVGVSATTVAAAATPSGFQLITSPADSFDEEPNEYMMFGNDMEPFMARWAQREAGLVPNDWLIVGSNPAFGASPDGLAVTHRVIGEYKTTGDPWDGAELGDLKRIPIKYRRQVQWQLLVTGAEACVFAWMLRERDVYGEFYSPWLEPRWTTIHPDPKMQAQLVEVAERLLRVRAENF